MTKLVCFLLAPPCTINCLFMRSLQCIFLLFLECFPPYRLWRFQTSKSFELIQGNRDTNWQRIFQVSNRRTAKWHEQYAPHLIDNFDDCYLFHSDCQWWWDILRFHRNCQAVRDCGGLKTMCELVTVTYSENVLERTLWALGNLAIDNK